MKNIIYFYLILLLIGCSSNIDTKKNTTDSVSSNNYETYSYQGFTLEEIRKFNERLQNKESWFREGKELNRYAHLHFSELFNHGLIKRSGETRKLPEAPRKDISSFISTTTYSDLGELPLNKYLQKVGVDGLIVLHKGQIVFEGYPRMFQNDFHICYSVSKVFVSTAIAILEDHNKLDVRQPIDFYFDELKSSGWQGVPVIDILAMSSGIDCPEIFSGPDAACFNRICEAYGWPPSENALKNPLVALATVESKDASGKTFEYTSINTIVLTMLVEKVSGTTFTDFIEKEIWQKMGAENYGLMLKTSYGRDATMLGISTTLRDLARFGLLFVPSGRTENDPVISDAYLKKIQTKMNKKLQAQSWFSEELKCNGYQWDEIYEDGDFYKSGLSGQGLYISPSRDLVIAFFGTYNSDLEANELPYISRQLARSGLFDE